jgi:hypothetical protein
MSKMRNLSSLSNLRILSPMCFMLLVAGVTVNDAPAQTQTPEVVYTSYFGGSGDDRMTGAANAIDGTAIIVGFTASPSLPGTGDSPSGASDVFVSKVTVPEDTTEQGQVLWTTLIGGSGFEDGGNVVVGPDGRIYVVGITQSSDFPEINPLYAGGGTQDCFLAILDDDGTVLTSTRIGGSDMEGGGTSQGDPSLASVALDADGNIYVACESLSGDFPSGNSGGSPANWRAVVVKLSESNNVLTEALGITYAASGNVFVDGVAVDDAGNIYLTGGVEASDLPLKDAVQSSLNGFSDAYVAVFDPSGALETGTYWGGSGFEIRDGIAVDVDGNVHVWGSTTSEDFPVVNAFQETYGGGTRDGFAVVFGPLAKTVLGSSYIGGSDFDEVGAFVRDDQGNLIYGGRSLSDDFLPEGQSGGTALAKSAARPIATGMVLVAWNIEDILRISEFGVRTFQRTGDLEILEAQIVEIVLFSPSPFVKAFATLWFGSIVTTPNAAQPENPNGENAINVGALVNVMIEAMPAMPNLELTKTVSEKDPDGTIHIGEVITFTITVRNTGDAPATNFKVVDEVEEARVLLETVESPCQIVDSNSKFYTTVECTPGELAPGDEIVIEFDAIADKNIHELLDSTPVSNFVRAIDIPSGERLANAEVEYRVEEMLLTMAFLSAERRRDQNAPAKLNAAATLDVYVDSVLVADDLAELSGLRLPVTIGRTMPVVDLVDGTDPDNGNPLASFTVDLVTDESGTLAFSPSNLFVIAGAPNDSLTLLVKHNARTEADDPAAVELLLVNAAAGAGTLDFHVMGGGLDQTVGPMDFGAFSDYLGGVPGDYDVEVLQSGDGASLGIYRFALDAYAGEVVTLVAAPADSSGGASAKRATVTLVAFDADGALITGADVTAVDGADTLPQTFALRQNYPNPFEASTTIRYDLPVRAEVRLAIYDVLGRTVRTLVAREQFAGAHAVVWDGRDDAGREVASGLYVYRLTAGAFTKSAEMILLK